VPQPPLVGSTPLLIPTTALTAPARSPAHVVEACSPSLTTLDNSRQASVIHRHGVANPQANPINHTLSLEAEVQKSWNKTISIVSKTPRSAYVTEEENVRKRQLGEGPASMAHPRSDAIVTRETAGVQFQTRQGMQSVPLQPELHTSFQHQHQEQQRSASGVPGVNQFHRFLHHGLAAVSSHVQHAPCESSTRPLLGPAAQAGMAPQPPMGAPTPTPMPLPLLHSLQTPQPDTSQPPVAVPVPAPVPAPELRVAGPPPSQLADASRVQQAAGVPSTPNGFLDIGMQCTKVEKHLLGEVYEGELLSARIARLEICFYGSICTGGLKPRLDALCQWNNVTAESDLPLAGPHSG